MKSPRTPPLLRKIRDPLRVEKSESRSVARLWRKDAPPILRWTNPTATRGTRDCFASFRQCAFATDHHSRLFLQRIFCPLRMYCCRRRRPSAPSSRHALSANGGLRVHQDIRKHVVEKSVQALLAPRVAVTERPCDGGASRTGGIAASARFTPSRPGSGGVLSRIPLNWMQRHVAAVATWIFPACRSRGKARPKNLTEK